MTPTVSSQEDTIPDWIKNTASWWASEQIPDSAFLQGIQYLIKEEIIIIHSTEASESSQPQEVPTWIKNTAGWWADNKISEVEFVNAIQYLIKYGIIIVNNNSSCVNDLSEILDDSNSVVQDICDLHESSNIQSYYHSLRNLILTSMDFVEMNFLKLNHLIRIEFSWLGLNIIWLW